MKIFFNPNEIFQNPQKTYKTFYNTIISSVSKKQTIDGCDFYAAFKTFAEVFEKQKRTAELTSKTQNMIEFLVNQGQNNIAGIAYSILIKLNKNNPQIVEKMAIKGLAIARKAKDPIHTMARARDLVEIYEKSNRGCEEHIKYLRIANKALNDICKNYETSVDFRFNRISSGLKPLENYELLLCSTKLDIVKYTYKQDLFNARCELEKAKLLFEKNKNSMNEKTLNILSRRIAKRELDLNCTSFSANEI